MNYLQLAGPSPTTGVGGTLSFTTLAEFQAFIIEDNDSGEKDALKQVLLDSACYGAFSRMGGRYILRPATAFDYVMASYEGDVLHLPQFPIGTITLVQTGYMSADGTWTSQRTIPTSEYYADARKGLVYGYWPTEKHRVRITWSGGFASAEVPADVKEALWMWAAVKYQRNRRARWDVKTIQAATQGYTYHDDDCPPAAAAVFSKYQLIGGSIR